MSSKEQKRNKGLIFLIIGIIGCIFSFVTISNDKQPRLFETYYTYKPPLTSHEVLMISCAVGSCALCLAGIVFLISANDESDPVVHTEEEEQGAIDNDNQAYLFLIEGKQGKCELCGNERLLRPYEYEYDNKSVTRFLCLDCYKSFQWSGNEGIYLMAVCPPYAYPKDYYKAPECFSMMGKKFFHGFEMEGAGYAYFNLNGEYQSLEFDFGHVDDTYMGDASFAIYLDDEYWGIIEGTSDMMVQHVTVPLEYALQMKIVRTDKGPHANSYYGFANAILTK